MGRAEGNRRPFDFLRFAAASASCLRLLLQSSASSFTTRVSSFSALRPQFRNRRSSSLQGLLAAVLAFLTLLKAGVLHRHRAHLHATFCSSEGGKAPGRGGDSRHTLRTPFVEGCFSPWPLAKRSRPRSASSAFPFLVLGLYLSSLFSSTMHASTVSAFASALLLLPHVSAEGHGHAGHKVSRFLQGTWDRLTLFLRSSIATTVTLTRRLLRPLSTSASSARASSLLRRRASPPTLSARPTL